VSGDVEMVRMYDLFIVKRQVGETIQQAGGPQGDTQLIAKGASTADKHQPFPWRQSEHFQVWRGPWKQFTAEAAKC
jgi:hypothetical protein